MAGIACIAITTARAQATGGAAPEPEQGQQRHGKQQPEALVTPLRAERVTLRRLEAGFDAALDPHDVRAVDADANRVRAGWQRQCVGADREDCETVASCRLPQGRSVRGSEIVGNQQDRPGNGFSRERIGPESNGASDILAIRPASSLMPAPPGTAQSPSDRLLAASPDAHCLQKR